MKYLKILTIILALVLCMVNIQLISNYDKVIVNAEEVNGDYNSGINLSYIWEITQILANVTYKAYNDTDIPRGRSFGSKGGNYTIEKILIPEMDNNSLEDIDTEQIQHNPNPQYSEKEYTTIINVTDFQLQVYNSNEQYPFPNFVPKNESFPIPKGMGEDLDEDTEFDNISIIPINFSRRFRIIDWLKDIVDFDYTIITNNCYINRYQDFAGQITYLNETANIPDLEDQYGKIYLLDETDNTNNQIENLSSSSGYIIIDNATCGGTLLNKTSFSVANLSNAEGLQLKTLTLENNDTIGYLENGVLTIMYNFNFKLFNDYAVIIRIPNHYEIREYYDNFFFSYYNGNLLECLKNLDFLEWLKDTFFPNYNGDLLELLEVLKNLDLLEWLKNTFFPPEKLNGYLARVGALNLILSGLNIKINPWQCQCFVLFDSYDQHLMIPTDYNWEEGEKLSMSYGIPMFTVNNSVGQFIHNNWCHTTISGWIDQELEKEEDDKVGVTAYNVWGNLTIPQNPGDKIAVISNRIDGWWGQTPGDSGLGGAIVLGIARLMADLKNDYNILPKYNTTFLFTTGEEYGLRGAHYYSDLRNESDDNKTMFWLVLDELGFDQNDTVQEVSISNKTKKAIIEAIKDDSDYANRTGFKVEVPDSFITGTEQAVYANTFRNADVVCFAGDKYYEWDRYHRTGNNYTEGDSMKYMDRNMGNVTAEVAFEIVKYFLYNPNCYFDGTVTYQSVDSTNDNDLNCDSINATFTVKTSLPVDKVRVRAMMKTLTNNTKFWKDFDFIATSEGTQKTITVTLPPTLILPGYYHLYLQLLNSTERIDEIVEEGSGTCNDTEWQTNWGNFLYPRGNTNANKPDDIQGPDTLKVLEPGTFNSSTTDPNNDQLQYHWDWGIDTDRVGPYASGVLCSINHTYLLRGWKTIKVKVREDYKGQLFDGGCGVDLFRYGDWSQWSDPYYIEIDPLLDFDLSCTSVASSQSAMQSAQLPSVEDTDSIYEGFAFGGTAPYIYTWYFEGNPEPPPSQQTVTYNYNQTGIMTTTLNVTDHDGYSEVITTNITVVNISASYNLSLSSLYTLPGENITFSDTSAVISSRCIENWTWDFGDGTVGYESNASHSYSYPGLYNITLNVTDDELETDTYTKTIIISYDDIPPVVESVFSSLDGMEYGANVSIVALVTDDISGVKDVRVNITKPDNTTTNLSMTHTIYDKYYCVFNDTTQIGVYNYGIWVVDQVDNMNLVPEVGEFTIDFEDPQITNVSASSEIVGFGYNVTITADISDSYSGVDTVNVNIIYPDETQNNYTMSYITNNTYQYVFSDTWLTGQYDYIIWAEDNSMNINSSNGHHFNVSAYASISVATLKDSYGSDEFIDITDPPNPPENYMIVDRGLTWNEYYDATSGNNVLEAYTSPVNYQDDNGTWTPINCSFKQLPTNHPAYSYDYRFGNEHGLYNVYFKPNTQSNWPVAFAYNKSDDPNTHVVRSKLVGVGYLDPASNWAYEFLQNVQNSQGQFTDNKITYEDVFTGTDVTWSYDNMKLKEEITLSNTTKSLLQNHPPSLYGLQNDSSYLVFITKLDYQNLILYNASGTLNGNVTISDGWIGFKDDVLGYFKCALPIGEAYELYNESVQHKLVYRILQYNGNYYLLSGLKVQDLNNMMFPVVIDPTITVFSSESDGYIYKSGSDYDEVYRSEEGTVSCEDSYISIGQSKVATFPPDYRIRRGFLFFDTSELPSNAYIDNATLSLFKKDDYSTTDFTITVQNGQPDYPHDPLEECDYNNEYYSGSGGELNTINFVNGSNNITLSELGWINIGGVTKLCLRSNRDINGTTPNGNEYVNVYSADYDPEANPDPRPKLIIIYRNQSKIKNTGSTNITGYLLMQVQYLEGEEWVVDNDTVNESSSRTILVGNQLALDAIFNGLVNTNELCHGGGTYRVYAAFRDPEGNILMCDDDSLLEVSYEFTVNI